MSQLKFNLSDEPDAPSFEAIPAGDYYLKFSKVDDSKFHADGWQKWGWQLKVAEGKCKGRIVFDHWIFSPSKKATATEKAKTGGLVRVKDIRKKMGLPVGNDVEISKEEYLNRVHLCKVEVEKDYKDPVNGPLRNKIPFNGYLEMSEEQKIHARELEVSQEQVANPPEPEVNGMDDGDYSDVPF